MNSLNTLAVIFIALFFTSCNEKDFGTFEPSFSKNKIMSLGASRVVGQNGHESFRYDLWKLLVDSDFEFDFIGTKIDKKDYPVYKGKTFDPQHQGMSGWTSGMIEKELKGWLRRTDSPDFVIFSSPGGNDLKSGFKAGYVMRNVERIISTLKLNNESVIILIEKMAPARTGFLSSKEQAELKKLNEKLDELIGDPTIIVVDNCADFVDDFLEDNVHYNAKGAKHTAENHFDELRGVLR